MRIKRDMTVNVSGHSKYSTCATFLSPLKVRNCHLKKNFELLGGVSNSSFSSNLEL